MLCALPFMFKQYFLFSLHAADLPKPLKNAVTSFCVFTFFTMRGKRAPVIVLEIILEAA